MFAIPLAISLITSFDGAFGTSFVNVSIAGIGVVQGTKSQNVEIFKGIPFAEAPIGDLRFKPPKSAKWSGFRNATRFGNMCPQRDFISKRLVLNEDCLYLNIYRPAKRSGKLAVMVWVHGGGFIVGAASQYNGHVLAALHGVIVVTIQYRLGVLGFFNVPNTDVKGNFGMLDQIEALRWVKRHIGDFDGDPRKVTIFGESAGGASVSLLTLSPMIKDEGLFSRAIAQSGVGSSYWAVQKASNDNIARNFGRWLQCNDVRKLVSCLKTKPTSEILLKQDHLVNESTSILTAPNVDGQFLKELPSKLVAANAIPNSNVSLIVGFNENEGTYFAGDPRNSTEQSYEKAVKLASKMYFGQENKVLNTALLHEYTKYHVSNLALKWFESLSDFHGDSLFAVDAINLADAWSKSGNTVYMYLFSHLPEHLILPYLKVTHGLEIPYVFGFDSVAPEWSYHRNFTAVDRNISIQCIEKWVSFAKNGFPGKGWPKYSSNTRQYLNIKNPLTVQSQPWPNRMDFWNKVAPQILNGTVSPKCKDNLKASSPAVEGTFALLLSCILFNKLI